MTGPVDPNHDESARVAAALDRVSAYLDGIRVELSHIGSTLDAVTRARVDVLQHALTDAQTTHDGATAYLIALFDAEACFRLSIACDSVPPRATSARGLS